MLCGQALHSIGTDCLLTSSTLIRSFFSATDNTLLTAEAFESGYPGMGLSGDDSLRGDESLHYSHRSEEMLLFNPPAAAAAVQPPARLLPPEARGRSLAGRRRTRHGATVLCVRSVATLL